MAEGRREPTVAFVLSGLGVVPRGAEAFVSDLATALARRGFPVTTYGRGEPDLPGVETVRIRALPRDTPWLQRAYRASRLLRKVLDTLFLDPVHLEWATASLAALPKLWRRPPAVLVMEGGLVGAEVARLLRRFRGVAFVDVAHGVDPKWEGAFARRRPDRVVVFTEAARGMLAREAPRARVQVIPHGVDLERHRPDVAPALLPLPRPVVLAVGAVDEHKRLDLAVRAVAAMDQPAALAILGDGPEAAAVDRLAARLLPGRYHRGTVARHDLPAWYAAADVFTLPSRTESFGLVYLEALACGTPVVAPDDAVRRRVVASGGVLTEVADAGTYAAALERALATDWGEAPRRQAEGFPFAATVDAYAELFRELAQPRASEEES